MWLESLPHADVTRVENAGHFMQEDAHAVVIPALPEFVDELRSARGAD
ncbi:MAG: pimeloyl-ACP methyl ester carboxylesterase [Glaciecola sp.]|jgi:pimeloyl-ACP methyl ester carboxylesterase